MKHEDYTVGWICALPTEMAAAQTMLDTIHDPLRQNSNDDNIYILGRIRSHGVVIACLPAGVTGINSAATVATRMIWSFPSVRIGLMVGIGGGAPSREHDIRLGDVVVGRAYQTLGGVIQYDFSKTVQEGRFIRTGSLNRPPNVLLNAVASLQAKHLMKEPDLSRYLVDIVSRYPKLRRTMVHQGMEHDLLFEADYYHLLGESDCSTCDFAKLISRAPRESNGPEVHYGLIASGNQVMKDGSFRERLRAECNVLCFETEAAGLMDNFPCIVIRGICDYADSHKNKRWQAYAAATAAAYAKELLYVITATETAQKRPVDEYVEAKDVHVTLATLSGSTHLPEEIEKEKAYVSKQPTIVTIRDISLIRLMKAVSNGDEVVVRDWLKSGADCNENGPDGMAAIHHAASKGNKAMTQLLLEKGADPNAKSRDGRTPLSWAAEGGYDAVVNVLLTYQNLDANLHDLDGVTPLSWAARCGHDGVVKLLIEWDGIDLNFRDKDSCTPLTWAACRGQNAVVKVLLGLVSIKPNCRDNQGLTPLSWAAGRGWDPVVKALLSHTEVNRNAEDNDGSTPLLWAACRGQDTTVQLLLAADDVEPDARDTKDRTPLSWAADRGYDKVIRLLLAKKGVNINSRDNEGSTPLLWAASHGHGSAVNLLIVSGADIKIGDKNDLTPLWWAKNRGYDAVVQLLESATKNKHSFDLAINVLTGVKSGITDLTSIKEIHAMSPYSSSPSYLPDYQLERPSPTFHVTFDPKSYLFDDSSMNFNERIIESADHWMEQYETLLEDRIEPILNTPCGPQTTECKINIAILDTGVDWKDPFIRSARKRIANFRNFVGDRENVQAIDKQCVDDDFGHGTHITALLLKTSLCADVYIARVVKDGQLGNPTQIADAIMWATDYWKVDMISMSFGFESLVPKIPNAIKYAFSKDVIMLAAAANHGGNATIAYPANQNGMVLGIHSTDGLGNPSIFTPSPTPKGENWSILGEAVNSSWPRRLGGPTKRKAGTCFATPIATGIAATMLYYAKVKFPRDKRLEHAGSVGKLKAMLSAMTLSRGEYDYVVSRELFDRKTDEFIYKILYN